MAKIKKPSPPEVDAYIYINKELTGKKGWKSDQIYTQQQCHELTEIKKYLGRARPENIIDINGKNFYVIEAKNERKKIKRALKEAIEDYANIINQSNKIKVLFATGIAGNDAEGYIAKSVFCKNGKWESISENGVEVTGLLSKRQIHDVLQIDSGQLSDVEINEDEFLKTAENINENLHKNSINKDGRAKFISAILLAMADKRDIDITQNFDVLVNNINSRVQVILKKHDKLLFADFVKIDEPASPDNHIKIKEAIKFTYQELLNLNIGSAMNSGKDVLGKFYEVFLKYGNGAKDIGIVLTPRHITKFASCVLDITCKDLVLDSACGTGGFLVSAYDEVKRKTSNTSDFKIFQSHGLYGIEEQDVVISLAIVNMIFRGDGKNNIIGGNCFKKWLDGKMIGKNYSAEYLSSDYENRIQPITKVMINPPFAKNDEKEYRFVEHALDQMVDEGILFAVLPISVLIERNLKKWRRDVLLGKNRLMAVITFPGDLFYPSSLTTTLGLFVKKGVPHNYDEHKVYFARCTHDGFIKKKGVRKESKRVRSMLEEIKDELRDFIKDQNQKIQNVPEFKKICLLDKNDDGAELAPEGYIDDKTPTLQEIEEGVEKMIREAISFKIKYNEKLSGVY